MTKDDIHKFFKRADVRQLGVTHVNETMYFQLYDLMRNGPMNNMVQEQYGKSMLRAVTTQTNVGSLLNNQGKNGIILFIQDKNLMVQLNNKIENRNRIAIFLASLDDEMSKGGRVVPPITLVLLNRLWLGSWLTVELLEYTLTMATVPL